MMTVPNSRRAAGSAPGEGFALPLSPLRPWRSPIAPVPTPADIEATLDALEASLDLEGLRRYWGQCYWGAETDMAKVAIEAEGRLPLESVAAHSWHPADAVLLIGPQVFPEADIDLGLASAIATVHDKLEMFIGDWDPVGDGAGTGTHAFDPHRRAEKDAAEAEAAEDYRVAAQCSRLQAGGEAPLGPRRATVLDHG